MVQIRQRHSKPRKSLNQSVYDRIVERICDGDYEVGERLPTEEQLARDYGVSRVTVRQAMARLRDARLVVSLQGSGNYVGGARIGDTSPIQHLFEDANSAYLMDFRAGLEAHAAALAAENAGEQHIAAMNDALSDHGLSGEPTLEWLVRFRLADLTFHKAIYEASGNPVIIEILQSIVPLYCMRWLARKADLELGFADMAEDVFNEHSMIARAISAGNADSARSAMYSHLEQSRRRATEHRLSKTDNAAPADIRF